MEVDIDDIEVDDVEALNDGEANISAQRGQPLIHYSGKSSEVRLCQVFVCAFSVRSLKAAFKSFVE